MARYCLRPLRVSVRPILKSGSRHVNVGRQWSAREARRAAVAREDNDFPGIRRSAAVVGRTARRTRGHLEVIFGGPERARVIVLLAAVLAMSSADAATVGAAAIQLRKALHIDNTDIGLLVTVSSLVAAAASLPFGVLADRAKRTRILGFTVLLWGIAMLWSAASTSFTELLLARLALGVVTASSGPVVASMIGDYFPSGERGRVYSYILTGELIGAGIGFAVTGDVAALSWRAAFVLLALPTFVLARFLFRMPEPVRGALTPLGRDSDTDARPNPPTPPPGRPRFPAPGHDIPARPQTPDATGPRRRRMGGSYDPYPYPHDPYGDVPGDPSFGDSTLIGGDETDVAWGGPGGPGIGRDRLGAASRELPGRDFDDRSFGDDRARRLAGGDPSGHDGPPHETDAQRVARESGVRPHPGRILQRNPRTLNLSGVETFAPEFTREQYGVPQAVANLLILVIGVGAVGGVLVGGTLSDSLLRRRILNSRLYVAAGAALLTALLFLPAILTRSAVTALPYLTLAAFALMAQNPPIDAARLDIVPPLLWGRAEGIRGLLRTAAQSLAPVLFGACADLLGHGRIGLQWTFLVMLVPLLANGVILLIAVRSYPRDVATAAAAPLLSSPADAAASAAASSPPSSPPRSSPLGSSPLGSSPPWPSPPAASPPSGPSQPPSSPTAPPPAPPKRRS
jgi:MFS family permease